MCNRAASHHVLFYSVEPWFLNIRITLLCVLCTKHQVYCRLDRDDMAFASTLIWYHTYKKINTPRTGTNRLTQKYILTLTPPAICLPQLYVLHWINHWYQNFILQRWAISLLFKNYSRAEVTYLLTRFNRHSVKVGPGPRDPGTRDPGSPSKFKSGTRDPPPTV